MSSSGSTSGRSSPPAPSSLEGIAPDGEAPKGAPARRLLTTDDKGKGKGNGTAGLPKASPWRDQRPLADTPRNNKPLLERKVLREVSISPPPGLGQQTLRRSGV